MSEAKQRTLNLTMSASAQSLPLDGRVLTPEMTAEALNTFRGPQGPKGDDGFIKFEELTDEQRELLRGPRGFDGPAGPEGPMGPTGPAGEPGKDAPQDAFTPSNPPTAEQVGALPANGTAANANQLNGKSADEYLLKTDTAADSDKLGGKAPEYYIQPRNLLDNSDFEIAQAGYGEMHGTTKFAADRWECHAGLVVSKVSNGLEISSTREYDGMWQYLGIDVAKYSGKRMTAAMSVNGDVFAVTSTMGANQVNVVGNGVTLILALAGASPYVQVNICGGPAVINWIAVYEGEYTAENLPPYVPKGYAAELAECQRYYRRSFDDGVSNISYVGMPIVIAANSTSLQTVNFDTPMRTTPTIITYGYKNKAAYSVSDWNADSDIPNIIVSYISRHGFTVGTNASKFTTGGAYCFHYEAIADL